MDARRKRKPATAARETTTVPRPMGAADTAAILAKLDAVLSEQHELRRLVHRITVPVEVCNLREAAKRLCRSTKWVKTLVARGVFTDGRSPDRRVGGADLIFYADEIDIYRTEGERGVNRLRTELGRD